LKETTRRIGYDITQLNLENLQKIIRKYFSIHEEYQFHITYFDEDKDCITVTSNEELEEAMHVHQGKTLHFHIVSESQGCGKGHWYLHRKGIQLMGMKEYAKARELFRKQFSLAPTNATPVYNMACCDALLGDESDAIAHLNQAIDLGYSNSDHAQIDEDLISLHGSVEFQKVLVRMAEQNKNSSFVLLGGGCGRRWRGFGGGGCGRRGAPWKSRCGRFANCEAKEGEVKESQQQIPKVEKEVEKAKEKEEQLPEPIVLNPTNEQIDISPDPTPITPPQCIYPPLGQPDIPVQQQVTNEKSQMEKNLELMEEFGLFDRKRNLTALMRANGNIEEAVSHLLFN